MGGLGNNFCVATLKRLCRPLLVHHFTMPLSPAPNYVIDDVDECVDVPGDQCVGPS